jgi:hypothetical protein
MPTSFWVTIIVVFGFGAGAIWLGVMERREKEELCRARGLARVAIGQLYNAAACVDDKGQLILIRMK